MRRKILVPLDRSPGSETALLEAAELARRKPATVRLLHVAPRPEPTVARDGRVVEYADQEAVRVTHEVRAYLLSAAAAIPDLEVKLAVRFGDPVGEIVREAEGSRVDMIAMATHRRRGVPRLVEGSVAEAVARATPVPLLLVEYGAHLPALELRAPAPADARRVVTRRFWCAWSEREVEVEFVERGFPGLRWAVGVKSCTNFEPPSAIECQRRCLDPAYRRQWPPALPAHGETS
jgi:nucleotide-binding universal stress UspA family protein